MKEKYVKSEKKSKNKKNKKIKKKGHSEVSMHSDDSNLSEAVLSEAAINRQRNKLAAKATNDLVRLSFLAAQALEKSGGIDSNPSQKQELDRLREKNKRLLDVFQDDHALLAADRIIKVNNRANRSASQNNDTHSQTINHNNNNNNNTHSYQNNTHFKSHTFNPADRNRIPAIDMSQTNANNNNNNNNNNSSNNNNNNNNNNVQSVPGLSAMANEKVYPLTPPPNVTAEANKKLENETFNDTIVKLKQQHNNDNSNSNNNNNNNNQTKLRNIDSTDSVNTITSVNSVILGAQNSDGSHKNRENSPPLSHKPPTGIMGVLNEEQTGNEKFKTAFLISLYTLLHFTLAL